MYLYCQIIGILGIRFYKDKSDNFEIQTIGQPNQMQCMPIASLRQYPSVRRSSVLVIMIKFQFDHFNRRFSWLGFASMCILNVSRTLVLDSPQQSLRSCVHTVFFLENDSTQKIFLKVNLINQIKIFHLWSAKKKFSENFCAHGYCLLNGA